ncbi:hypothetical protein DHEL01_v204246 [Diaporthe helianthi]|uniref:FAD-binding PCMH-type domain-containing protein n=1 Tax=Diaporthe helianthi TaxID=158607 RepID=A0A2P5I4D1_DIAHE|nr:hypothetical protein DHEL01_v204246 [Diaporthe helianthi]
MASSDSSCRLQVLSVLARSAFVLEFYKSNIWSHRARSLTDNPDHIQVWAILPTFSSMALQFLFLGLLLRGSHAIRDIPPAAATLSTESAAGAELFSYEAIRLTESVLSGLNDQDDLAQYAQLFAFGNTTSSPEDPRAKGGHCKTYAGDSLWPSEDLWGLFDELLGNALSPIIPIASTCYKNSEYDNYDASICASVTEGWVVEGTHYEDPGSVMWPLYEGKTCLPGTDLTSFANCTQGGYSLYSVNISNVAQIQLAVNFARSLNLRLVVKNTGHDYNGRSTGYGALSLWTHNLKDIRFISSYETQDYSGPAFKLGAGVQGFELYEAAEAHGLTTISGICPTVGVVGGYVQGGGHSPVMQLFGMGADQVLALEVVTATGEFVTVTPEVNPDLYWAILGGGGGTFGIVTSAILKAHPRVPVTTSTFSFGTSSNVSVETFWKGVAAYWDQMPVYNAEQTYSYWSIINVFGSYIFTMEPFFATNKTIEEYNALVEPLLKSLSELGIPFNATTEHFDSFYPAYEATFATYPQNIGSISGITANRLLPAENWNNETIRATTLRAIKDTVDRATILIGYHQAPLNPDGDLNSVNPAFRKEASQLVIVKAVDGNATAEGLKIAADDLTNNIMELLKDVSPAGGAYNNEANVGELDWQNAFWGENYPRLLEIKKKWDPTGLFYVHHGVGSEAWRVLDGGSGGLQTQNGKLCRIV